MTAGFGGDPNQGRTGKDAKITIDMDNVDQLIKRYKKIKKYMKSPLFAVKTMDGTENYVSQLIKEAEENSID